MGASWHPPVPGPPAPTPEPTGSAVMPLFSMQLCSAWTSLVPFHWGGAGHTASISVGTSAHIHYKSAWPHLHQPQLVPSGPAPGRAHGAPGSGHTPPGANTLRRPPCWQRDGQRGREAPCVLVRTGPAQLRGWSREGCSPGSPSATSAHRPGDRAGHMPDITASRGPRRQGGLSVASA